MRASRPTTHRRGTFKQHELGKRNQLVKSGFRVFFEQSRVGNNHEGSIPFSVYNDKGYFKKNDLDAYSLNNLAAKPNADASFTVRFGGVQKEAPNYLPITPGWNHTVHLSRPQKEILDGAWKFPEAQPVR